MVAAKSALILMSLAMASCQTVKGDFCDVADPLRPSEASLAVMDDAEVNTLLAHNEKGARLCGWKP